MKIINSDIIIVIFIFTVLNALYIFNLLYCIYYIVFIALMVANKILPAKFTCQIRLNLIMKLTISNIICETNVKICNVNVNV